MIPSAVPLTVTVYVPAEVPLGGGVVLPLPLPLPHAVTNRNAPISTAAKHRFNSFRLFSFLRPAPLNSMAGIISPSANRIPPSWLPRGAAKADWEPAVAIVNVAVPILFVIEIAPNEHVAGELTAGVMLQLSVSVEGSSPPDGVIVTVALVEAPGATVEGDGALADRLKLGATTVRLMDCDALLKLLSPLYSAEIVCPPAAKAEVEKLAMPLALTAALPSVLDPLRKVTVPVGVPGEPEVKVAVKVTL